MKIKRAQIKRLADRMENMFPEICFAYLFGSGASGTMTKTSDIDIAVYLKEPDDKVKLLCSIIGLAEEIFPGLNIDVVILNETGILIAFEALKGIILFIREEARDLHSGFYSLTLRLRDDHLAWMKRQLSYRNYEVQWDH